MNVLNHKQLTKKSNADIRFKHYSCRKKYIHVEAEESENCQEHILAWIA